MAEDPVLDIQITLCITTDTTVIMDMILIMVLTIIGVMILSFIVAGTHRYFLVSVTVTGGTIVITDGTIIIIITATMITDIHTIQGMIITEIITIQTGIHLLFTHQDAVKAAILSLPAGIAMYPEEFTPLVLLQEEQSLTLLTGTMAAIEIIAIVQVLQEGIIQA